MDHAPPGVLDALLGPAVHRHVAVILFAVLVDQVRGHHVERLPVGGLRLALVARHQLLANIVGQGLGEVHGRVRSLTDQRIVGPLDDRNVPPSLPPRRMGGAASSASAGRTAACCAGGSVGAVIWGSGASACSRLGSATPAAPQRGRTGIVGILRGRRRLFRRGRARGPSGRLRGSILGLRRRCGSGRRPAPGAGQFRREARRPWAARPWPRCPRRPHSCPCCPIAVSAAPAAFSQ